MVIQPSLCDEHAAVSPWPAPEDRGDWRWRVLHVKSRQEKVVARDLDAMSIAHYLPCVTQTRYHGHRKETVNIPLFPGYVFLLGTLDSAYCADRTRRVAGIIEVVDQKQLEWELRNIHLALSRCAPLDPYPFLTRGVRVEVKSGPLAGLQGIIEDRARSDRLILQVRMLGAARSLEVDGALLEPLD